MNPIYPTLSEMVAAVTSEAHRAARAPVDSAQLERYVHSVLGDLQRSRPRITDYLPELALNQVLALLGPEQHPA